MMLAGKVIGRAWKILAGRCVYLASGKMMLAGKVIVRAWKILAPRYLENAVSHMPRRDGHMPHGTVKA